VVFPILALKVGVGYLQIGEVLSLYAAVSTLFYYPASLLAQRLGTKRVVLLSQILMIISTAILTLSVGFLAFTASYLLYGVVQAIYVQRANLIAYNTKGVKESTAWFSLTNSLNLFGRVIATGSVALIGGAPSVELLRTGFGVLTLVEFVPLLLLRSLKEFRVTAKFSLMASKSAFGYGTGYLITGFGFGITATLLQVWFTRMGLGVNEVGLAYLGGYTFGMLGSGLGSAFARNVVFSFAVLSVAFAAATVGLYLPVAISLVSYMVYSFSRFARSVVGSGMRTEVFKDIGEVEKGLGVVSVMGGAGDIAGTFAQGALFGTNEFSLPFIIGGASIVVGSALNIIFYRQRFPAPGSTKPQTLSGAEAEQGSKA
jgi:MFS family permease